MQYTKIRRCRICGSSGLEEILNLGKQALTGVFPLPGEKVEETPLSLVRCQNYELCGLVQLGHRQNLECMYGDNYGYRSGLNSGMVSHLGNIAELALVFSKPVSKEDIILDIGSNDGTLLGKFKEKSKGCTLVGMDPTALKFLEYYKEEIKVVPKFFSAKNFNEQFPGSKAKIITSIAMFYDLEDPQKFVEDIASILHNDGLWVLEQSYLPAMIKSLAYDTCCQEHLEYYGLKQIDLMVRKAGLRILYAVETDTNGGSILLVVGHNNLHDSTISTRMIESAVSANKLLLGYDFPISTLGLKTKITEEINFLTEDSFLLFSSKVQSHRITLKKLLMALRDKNKVVLGLGASTKGNVLLQYSGIDSSLLPFIAEVNSYKYGRVTPGTNIPIISEEEAALLNPDYYLVLPWHFKRGILKNFKEYIDSGGKMIFPLPEITIVDKYNYEDALRQ